MSEDGWEQRLDDVGQARFQERWIADGFPWCDTCGRPAVFSELQGNLHVAEGHRWGVPKHLDTADHVVTMRDWSERGRAERATP